MNTHQNAPAVSTARLTNVMENAAFYRLFDEAEQVRWKMTDIPWDSIDKSKVTPDWIRLMRQVAYVELTTFQATERFLKEFPDDVDFTQWLAVWLYEETKHPYVVMRWLKAFGEQFDSDFLLQGRETHPFMRSQVGTLSTNICSEIVASNSYLTLYKHAPEPVLKGIVKNLAADEARHASHFFTYARKRIDAAKDRNRAKIDALSVLYFWIETNENVKHPVNLAFNQYKKLGPIPPAAWDEGLAKAHARMFGMCSTLVGRTVRDISDLQKAIAELSE